MKGEKKREALVVSHKQEVTVGLIIALLLIRDGFVRLSDKAAISRRRQQTQHCVSQRSRENVTR